MRSLLFIGGMMVLAACWLGPLPDLAHHAFYAHMTMHMGVVAVAAGLLALGLAGSRWDPVCYAPRLLAPIPASVLELLVVWAWHAPGPHHFARHSAWGLVAEQGSFLACGLVLWLSAFGGPLPRSGARMAAGIIGLLLTSMHMTLLGALLIFASRPLYDHASHAAGSLPPLTDQQLGGAIMLLVGGTAYLAGGLWLTSELLRARPATEWRGA